MALFTLVQFDHLFRVDWQAFVRVYDDAEEPGVGLQAIISCIFSADMHIIIHTHTHKQTNKRSVFV